MTQRYGAYTIVNSYIASDHLQQWLPWILTSTSSLSRCLSMCSTLTTTADLPASQLAWYHNDIESGVSIILSSTSIVHSIDNKATAAARQPSPTTT
eukprot:3784077-Amphidinium_carterae.3